MSTIKQLLRLHLQGVSNRKIAEQIGLYKGTVNRYIQKLAVIGRPVEELLNIEDPVLERLFTAGSPAYLQDRFEDFKPLIPYLEKELGRKHVTRRLLWEEYRSDHPEGYGYSQFCHHLNQLSVARKGTAVFDHDPAHRLMVDFVGDTPGYVDRDSGEVIKVQVVVEKERHILAAPILITFPIDKWTVSNQARVNLGYFADVIKQGSPDVVYQITGYADRGTGSVKRNELLSRERAHAIYQVLVNEFGVSPSQLRKIHQGGVENLFYDPRLSRAVIVLAED